ncbi:MAG: nuclear transport factor 2 family protein [Acidobacteriota bacterium]
MKKIILLIASALMFASCGAPAANNAAANNSNKTANAANTATAPAADTAAIEADLKKLVTEYAASTAKNDVAAYEKTTTDNFMFVGNDGSVYTKAQRVDSMKSGATKYDSLTYDDINVRVNAEGNGAVVIAKATVKGMNMGQPIDESVRVTQVWSKTKDGWKMASLQATNITAKKDDKKADEKKADEKKAEPAPANAAKPAAPANK